MHALMLHTKKTIINWFQVLIYSWVVIPTLLHCNHLFLYHKNSCGLNSPNFGRQYTNVHGRNNKWPTNHNRTPEMNKIRHRKLVFWMGFYSSGKRHPSRQPQNHAMLTSLGQVGIVALILTIISSYFQ